MIETQMYVVCRSPRHDIGEKIKTYCADKILACSQKMLISGPEMSIMCTQKIKSQLEQVVPVNILLKDVLVFDA